MRAFPEPWGDGPVVYPVAPRSPFLLVAVSLRIGDRGCGDPDNRLRIFGTVHRPRLPRSSCHARQMHRWPRPAAEATRVVRATCRLAQGKSPERPRPKERTRCLRKPSSAGGRELADDDGPIFSTVANLVDALQMPRWIESQSIQVRRGGWVGA